MKIQIVPRTATATPSEALVIRPARVVVPTRPMRVLDFDCEARPLHWISSDYVSQEITAMAWAWCDEPEAVSCYLLGEVDARTMLQAFLEAYERADMVTGHFIRGFDLPLINAMLTEQQMPVLPDKLTHDTKIDKTRTKGLSSSQENLAATWELAHPKIQMNQKLWRDANRLTPEGLVEVRKRVVGDVQQHIELRALMLRLGYLGPPVKWQSGTAVMEGYTP